MTTAAPPTGIPGWDPVRGVAERVSADRLLAWLAPGARPLTAPLDGTRPDPLSWPGYERLRRDAGRRSGVEESVTTIRGRVRDSTREAVFVAFSFDFLGGSMGTVAGQRIAAAYDSARALGLPVVVSPSTGGARMQEGMASLVQMAATSAAAIRHGRDGLLQVAVVRDPTTGGVFASHANLADVILAEPHATMGFAGPRVAEAMTGGRLPEGSHRASGARAAGLVDEIVPRPALPDRLAAWLAWPGPRRPRPLEVGDGARTEPADGWTQVQRARAPDRPRAAAFLAALEYAEELHGDRSGGDDPALRVVAARLAGRPIMVLAMDVDRGGHITPSGYRKAWRGLRLACRLGVPVVTLIDTPGADASAASEAGGIAHHIAASFRELLEAPVPVVALVTGQGGSGGALALAAADRLLIQEHAVFSVIAPEGAAAILYRDRDRAADVAGLLDPSAQRLAALGIADEVVAEPAGVKVVTAWAAVARHLDDLATVPVAELVTRRLDRWRTAGVP